MDAKPVTVIEYFNGEKQNLIPLFQRPYTWKIINWQTLWDDLMVQYEVGEKGTHFMGAIVSVSAYSTPVGVNKHLIIDGQQRLTTVSIVLCALRDCLAPSDPNAASRIHEVYLTNRFREPEDTLKFVPTQLDREAYRKIALDRESDSDEGNGLIFDAYHFFKEKILSGVDLNEEPISPGKVLTILERCIRVVMINLADDDDPYLIFESLNFKGEPLTQADLVRNYLLMRFRHSISDGGEQDRIYSKYWKPLEETLGFNLTEFLRHYMMKDGDNIKQGGIYAAIRTRLKAIDSTEVVESEVQSIGKFGEFYAKFILPQQESKLSIRNCLENIKELKVTTAYPLLLRLFDARENNFIDDSDLEKCLILIESFIVRRAICGVQTNPLNKLFIQWARNFPEINHVEWLHRSLSLGSASRRFPTDTEFAEAFKNHAQYSRGSTRFILCRLEESFNHREIVDLSNMTIEHVLPQTISQVWKDEIGANADQVHSLLVHTFGNLTLTAYNSELSNSPFLRKKELLENTHVELNRWILRQDSWKESQIRERADDLFLTANKIWISPLENIHN
jgi:uncharacterized protein with ParB-like and HNH nuclease domain